MIISKQNKHKKQYEKDQQTIKCFDKLYRKSLQDNLIVKNEYESVCKILKGIWTKHKGNLFYKHDYKSKINFFK